MLIFCWFLVASVLLIRSQDMLVYSKHMGFYKVRHRFYLNATINRDFRAELSLILVQTFNCCKDMFCLIVLIQRIAAAITDRNV